MPYPKNIKIGNVKIDSPLIMAPMAGITSLPYRSLCREFGAKFAFAEMICLNAIIYNNPATKEMLSQDKHDSPVGFQALTAVEEDIPRALDMIPYFKYDILDFNAACPQRKVTSKGRGAALMQEPDKLAGLLKACVAYSKVPVTVKLRLGWDNARYAVDLAKMCEDCGVKAVFLHGRTRSQGYHGTVHYEAMAKVKKALTVPMIASGDIFNGPLAKKMFDETGCDGLLVARGAMGNPWLIKEIEEHLKHVVVLPRPAGHEVARVMHKHLKMYVDFFGEQDGVNQFHKFFAWYSRGFHGVRPLRDKGMRVRGYDNFKKLIDDFEAVVV